MNDVIGQAIYDYHHKVGKHKLWILNQYGPKEEMPVEAYFRTEDDMPDMEWHALNECRGRVLDIGAAAGCHSLLLQERNYDVTAMDISPLAVQVMSERGIVKTIAADIYRYQHEQFDTLFLLMNGIGLAGTIEGLKLLLEHFKLLLKPGGQILFDSSDITYLYEGAEKPTVRYYGEVSYQYQYKGKKTDWFNWLYVDEHTMQQIATECGYKMEVLLEDEYGQYLGRLTF
ncbi:class I SAM-dependent methyltransferase [Mucilaginibacter myungsuensis]|uniref:Class I SAM-dependent methyltransferase n=1 Tax=Mucilaginibacter myungsuensis TaxID=649104 RepID=A0A929L091_9SPHI|nr:class I SAM-dependent methyltransferase [Mucilaginibacter myungsuensis]MBE9661785.1 class I SAM-dependent methyltransferase [Mucilaginibacter myungsuensis]MDN3599781.1 class I SAM-dependent methyltransferase [Mucilaginibacter myungsuensis]